MCHSLQVKFVTCSVKRVPGKGNLDVYILQICYNLTKLTTKLGLDIILCKKGQNGIGFILFLLQKYNVAFDLMTKGNTPIELPRLCTVITMEVGSNEKIDTISNRSIVFVCNYFFNWFTSTQSLY